MELGDRVKDKVTGFTGIIIGVCEYLNGCTQMGIRPEKLKDGKRVGVAWIDDTQLRLVKRGKYRFKVDKNKVDKNEDTIGGPQSEPISMTNPS